MARPAHTTHAVRAHYAVLAGSYDQKANRACNHAYLTLIHEVLGGCARVLELGAGSSPRAGALAAPHAVACDLSWPMLAARNAWPDMPRVVADAQHLPLAPGAFDGAFSVNVLEHVPDPKAFVAEAARVLAPGGLLLSITPNGGLEWLLDLLERLHLKLPEGPHRFLTSEDLRALAHPHFEVVEQRKFLALPAGPPALVNRIDTFGSPANGRGLFLYSVARRRP
jgi:SAM-dependent methyltransferase